jgi:hypothetical protein
MAPVVIISPVVTAPVEIVPIAPVVRSSGGCPIVTLPFINPTNRTCLLLFLGLAGPDEAAEVRGRQGALQDAAELGIKLYAGQLDLYTLFIAYGVSAETRRLGERERRAVIRDAIQVIGYAATEEDLHLISVGQRPRTRNPAKEQAQLANVRSAFRRIYKRDPNFKNATENLVWNTLMYRIRFPRDLAKEKLGILSYRALVRRPPVSPLDWALVRALGYIKR